ncbi:uncharacterized protein EV420DRAFT_1259286, partial [Desarmillaria tabescens]
KRKDYQFCSDRCTNLAAKKAPQLMRVLKGHVFYENVKKMFVKQWNDQRQHLPTIMKIYLITWTAYQHTSFEKYCRKVARMRKIGKGKLKELCSMSNCRLCPTIRTAFKSSLEYKHQMVMNNATTGIRFGGGLYMSPSSNRAIKYALNLLEGSEYLTVLVTRTVLGKMQFLKDEQHHRLSPDKGYDSVKACTKGGPLEYVTYRKDAVHPAYLLMINKHM